MKSSVENSRPYFQQTIPKRKGDFVKNFTFSDSKIELLYDIPADRDKHLEYVQKDTTEIFTMCGVRYAEHEVVTTRVNYETRGMNHIEGGWPKDINSADVEQTVRFKKKIEKDETYMHSVRQLSHIVEHCILQNNAVNLYELYFNVDNNEDFISPVNERHCYKTLNVFPDPCKHKRPVQHISWSPDGGTHIAASYCSLAFQQTRIQETNSYIWDVVIRNGVMILENPIKPEVTLQPNVPIVCVEYNPKDPHSLISGLFNGQIAFWDARKGSDPVDTSPAECSHKDPVFNTLWINSKSGTEFFSSSPDGQLKWWDVRKLSEPLETLVVDLTKGEIPKLTRAHGISVLEYESSIPIKFMIGTETGLVIAGNRKGKTSAEKLTAQYRAHYGPVCALQRNPAFVKIFLSVGDWCVKIWSEDCKESAIMWTNYHKTRLTSGAWNPARYSIFYTTRIDGSLDLWDVLHQQQEPNLSIKVCDEPLTCIRCHENGQLVTTADNYGNIYLLKFSEDLAMSAKNDKAFLTSIFERECRREKIIESKMKEMRLKTRVGKVIDTHIATKDTIRTNPPVNLEQVYIEAVEKEFFAIIEEV